LYKLTQPIFEKLKMENNFSTQTSVKLMATDDEAGLSIFCKCTSSTSLLTGGTFFFLLKFWHFHEYLIQHSLKLGGTVQSET
jgi:hypothetical protein